LGQKQNAAPDRAALLFYMAPHAPDRGRGPAFRGLGCCVYGQPSLGDDSGNGDGVGDCKGRFRIAWRGYAPG
jgi:hypothetical protein